MADQSAEEMRKELQALMASTQQAKEMLGGLKKKKVHKGKVRTDCRGPAKGVPCPDGAFTFLPEKASKWLCNKCVVKRGGVTFDSAGNVRSIHAQPGLPKPKTKTEFVFRNKNGEIQRFKTFGHFLDYNTLRWEPGPNGDEIRIAFTGRPLEKKYHEWWNLRKYTKDTVPEGYRWCPGTNFPIKKDADACTHCQFRSDCGKFQLDESRKKAAELTARLRTLTEPERKEQAKEREARKKEREAKKKQDEQAEKDKQALIKSTLDKYVLGMVESKHKCGGCKLIDLRKEKMYWAYDGTRWIRQVTGRIEMENPEKKRCNGCYAAKKL